MAWMRSYLKLWDHTCPSRVCISRAIHLNRQNFSANLRRMLVELCCYYSSMLNLKILTDVESFMIVENIIPKTDVIKHHGQSRLFVTVCRSRASLFSMSLIYLHCKESLVNLPSRCWLKQNVSNQTPFTRCR